MRGSFACTHALSLKTCSGQTEQFMSLRNLTINEDDLDDGTLEECLEEINDFVATLRRYPPAVLAVAIGAHLETLLRALAEAGMCTRRDVQEFVKELERESLRSVDED